MYPPRIRDKKMKEILKFIKAYKTVSILAAVSLCYAIYCNGNNYSNVFEKISYSIIAATIFYIFTEYVPFRRKEKTMRKLIDAQLRKLYRDIDNCRKRIISPYNFNPKTYKDSNEYADDFDKVNLEEKGFIDSSQTRKLYLESYKIQIVNTITNILNFNLYLSNKEVNNLTDILNSPFIAQPICSKNYDLTDEELASYPNNQREIGKSIYEVHELINEILKKNRHTSMQNN